MSLSITLTADTGVDFNAGFAAFFDGFTPYGMPLFLGATDEDTTQIVHLDTPVTGAKAETRAVLLEGEDFLYTFANHSVSGVIDTVRLVQLGAAYDADTGDLATVEGVVTTASDYITISGLGIVNAAGVKGAVHEIVAGLMGGGLNGTAADASAIWAAVLGQAHSVTGSGGDDRYSGTRFGDTVRGMGGDDTLSGAGGRDWIDGGAGDDVLTGGAGADHFIFAGPAAADGDRIRDFGLGADRIHLTRLDADSTTSGNQAFDFIGSDGFGGTAGELRVVYGKVQARLMGDTDGDGLADVQITLTGVTEITLGDLAL